MEKRVLLIDDSPVDRAMYRRLLEKTVPGLKFEEASNARDGLSLLRKNRYDCAFLDFNMPDGTGLEVLQQLDHSAPSPIIMLTGTDDTETAVEVLKAGASDYLIKDRVDSGALVSAMMVATHQGGARDAQDAVRRHHDLTYALTQHGEVAMLIVDLTSLTLIEATAVGLARLGYRRNDVVGRDVRTLDLFGGKAGWTSFVGSLRDNEAVQMTLGTPGSRTINVELRSQAVRHESKPYLLAWVRPAA